MFEKFHTRHIGISETDIDEMLKEIGEDSMESLVKKTIPNHILLNKKLNLEKPYTEYEALKKLRLLASKNKIFDSYIGLGYYPTITPSVIQRNVVENPGWYTQYTPYQAEISQGRLEVLLNFQTMISDLTGMDLANSSLLDEGTAAGEAIMMLHNARKRNKKSAEKVFIDENIFPQTKDVILSRTEPRNIIAEFGTIEEFDFSEEYFAVLVQNPDNNGEIKDYSDYFAKAKEKGIYVAVIADILSLALITPPGEIGADVVLGNSQRLGEPLGYGGPHAAYFATKEEFKRQLPGRIIGVSVDRTGKKALRMALQTREQHIKREKATSNICTAQVLLAIIAGFYGVYHGPEGLENIAKRINKLTIALNKGLTQLGFEQVNGSFFDTLKIKLNKSQAEMLKSLSLKYKMNFRWDMENFVGISISEITTPEDIEKILSIFATVSEKNIPRLDFNSIFNSDELSWDKKLARKSKFMTHPVFNTYRSETEMMRYIKKLERKDLSLTHSMISLGSCTMKLNAATEMFPLSWPEFTDIHPFVPDDQAEGYLEMIEDLKKDLCEITGFADVSFQPNSGAQGEFTGLSVIMAYHKANGNPERNVVLIPASAHGTNPASSVLAGGKVVVVKTDENGNVDMTDLKEKIELNKDNLAALMITYPSTHGIFEQKITEMINLIHENGGLVYMDGANMNAQVGLTSPAKIGADVCHLNLHKTFAIPHGGGGPGAGPIAVNEKLQPFLPNHYFRKSASDKAIHATVSAPFGSALILTISYAYIKMMGEEGLRKATEAAILNANYLRVKLSDYYRVVYTGETGFVGHELIFDMHQFKQDTEIDETDISKRLMDYGFHAPTVSFPVHSTLMVEPTESESKAELDRFIETMIGIRKEIDNVKNDVWSKLDNPLKFSPHTAEDVTVDIWTHPYSREIAVFPKPWIKENKFWPAVNRIDNAYGDRHLFCSCPPMENYDEEK